MKIIFIGDLVGRAGRDAVTKHLPPLIERTQADFVIANGENAAHGFGITKRLCDDMYDAGVDCITLGNHAWDQRELLLTIDSEPRLVRPTNFTGANLPGRGHTVLTDKQGRKVLVINAMARLFTEDCEDPFGAVSAILDRYPLGSAVQATVLDFHGEATSEKQAMGWHCDGRASMVVGTHTHTPTSDLKILPEGTSYLTDAGMTGDYLSVLGMERGPCISRFTTRLPTDRFSPANGDGTLCGLMIETDDATGKTLRAAPLRIGPHLIPESLCEEFNA
ncbi:MAG: TIGR00282 family metallophosphoesterase [Alphaproteobacteria bacterium]